MAKIKLDIADGELKERSRGIVSAVRNLDQSNEILVPYEPSKSVSAFWKRIDDNISKGMKIAEKERLRFGGMSLPFSPARKKRSKLTF